MSIAWQQAATSSFCLQEDSGLYLDKYESHDFFMHFCLESKLAPAELIINAFLVTHPCYQKIKLYRFLF